MELRGLDVPADHRRWNWDQFVAAADFAARPVRGTKGVAVEPSLAGLAPFIYAGGGDVFDDDSDPSSLAFSSEDTQAALETVLQLFRDPKLTLTEDELDEKSAEEWFKEGRLGMITGSRALVPELRDVPGLRFDVMPIPSIESTATVGEITALCIAHDAESPATAADFMVYASGSEAVAEVVREGYLQPANQEVTFSDDFLQPAEMPLSATVFNEAATRMVVPPLLDTWDELEEAVAPLLHELLYASPTLDLPLVGEQIDEASQPILSPEEPTPTTSTSGATDSPSP
jgi:multiple sugar transport system substrate-binding protein